MPADMPTSAPRKPTVLVILDGWGYREDPRDNAIANASTPTWDKLWATAPRTLISSSGRSVGLPEGQMGNSEVGHMSLGAGRIVYQNISKIDKAIEDGAQKAGAPLTRLQQDAVNFVGELALRPDLEHTMDFQIGDIQWLNNYVMLHSREAFTDYDDPAQRRMLLRLWVNHDKVRPLNYDFANKALMGPRKGVKKRA